jgi:sulfite exporter TauE/SafE
MDAFCDRDGTGTMHSIAEYLPEILHAAGENYLSFTALGVVVVGLLAWRFERTGRMAVLLLAIAAVLILITGVQVFDTVRLGMKQRAEAAQRDLEVAQKHAAELEEARKPVRWTSGR